MRLDAPNALEVRYTRKMMSCLLFQPRPRRIVLIGLGGGSLVKFCHTRLPATQLVVLENNPDVIALRHAFRVPPDGPNLQVIEADGAAYLAQAEKGIDVLLVDAFDKSGFAPSLANQEFFEHAKTRLAGSGVLVVNLAGKRRTLCRTDRDGHAGLRRSGHRGARARGRQPRAAGLPGRRASSPTGAGCATSRRNSGPGTTWTFPPSWN